MRLECHISRANTTALVLLCPLIGCFGAMGVATGSVIIGWLGIVAGVLGLIHWVPALVRRGPQVIIDEIGIEDRRSPIGIIPWSEIVHVGIHDLEGNAVLNIEVADEALILAPLPRYKRLMLRAKRYALFGRSPFSIGFENLTPGLDEVMAFVEELAHLASSDAPDP